MEQCDVCANPQEYTGVTEINVVVTMDDNLLPISALLTGKRFDNRIMFDYIKANYKFSGIGLCRDFKCISI